MLKIVWLSANKFGYELLKEAIKLKDVEINSIITLNKKSKTIMYDEIDFQKWYNFGIDVYEIEDINNEKKLFDKLSPDIVIVCGWRQIINKDILKIPKIGFISFHPALLPIGRGPAPIINSILENFQNSGVSMFYLTENIDDGDIIGQEKFNIEKTDYAEEVYNKVIKIGKKLIKKNFPLLAKNKAPRIPQDHSKALIFKKPDFKNNKIDLDKESIDGIYNKIRALSKPYKGAYIVKDGKKMIIWRAELLEK
jgi:methionyl-tRNA formyltransferase